MMYGITLATAMGIGSMLVMMMLGVGVEFDGSREWILQ
jgi:hypothetical protein